MIRSLGRYLTSRVVRWPLGADLRGDLVGGATAAIVLLAIEGSYGIIAFGSLGPAYAQFGFVCAIFSTVVCNVVMALVGARGPMLSGPSAAMALLVPALFAALLSDPRFVQPGGVPHGALLLGFLAMGVTLAGVIQWIAGMLRVGGVVRYVPYTVLAGFMNGVAVMMVIAILPRALGLDSGLVGAWRHAQPLTAAVALATAWVALRPPRWARAVPRYLAGLLVGTALHYALAWGFGSRALGPVLGVVDLGQFAPMLLARLPRADLLGDHLGLLLQFALAVALIASLQSLLAASVIDGLTRQRRDGERELRAQGLANIALGLIGGLPAAGALSRTQISVNAGAMSGVSRLVFAAGLLLAITAGADVVRHIPLEVIAGVFVVAAFGLVDAWSRHASVAVVGGWLRRRPVPRALVLNFAVMLLVAFISAFVSVAHGVAAGVLLAMISFVRSHSRCPVRSVVHAGQRSSLKVRSGATAALLKAQGQRIVLIELDGALFFGTADAVAGEIERVTAPAQWVIVDFRRATEVDPSGARVIVQAADALHAGGKRMLFASLAADSAGARLIREMDLHQVLSDADFFADADRALEAAEDGLLQLLAPQPEAQRRLPLQETMLGAGVDAQQIACLESLLVERCFSAGSRIFECGDASDSLFVSVRGEVGIWLPNGVDPGRRVVCFAPGVVFGEMGLLQRQPRSATAIAEADTVVLELARAGLEQLASAYPRLLGTLMHNLNLHLAGRVRMLTDELQAR